MVIVSHDREFLDQLCTKIVETEFGRATTYKGNYTQYVNAKAEKLAQQWAAYEKQQKEIARQVGLPCYSPDFTPSSPPGPGMPACLQ
jgi:ATPase subunit of ABC transporter with duplicated ATPase domains